jgi:hypothetical protein
LNSWIFSASVHGRPPVLAGFFEGESDLDLDLDLDLGLDGSSEEEGIRYGFMSGGVDGEEGALGMLAIYCEELDSRLRCESGLKLDEKKKE